MRLVCNGFRVYRIVRGVGVRGSCAYKGFESPVVSEGRRKFKDWGSKS